MPSSEDHTSKNSMDPIKLQVELEEVKRKNRDIQMELDRMKAAERSLADANIRIAELYEEMENMFEELAQSQEVQRANQELQKQNVEITNYNEKFVQSLTYAYRIQSSLFQIPEWVKRLLPDSFVWLQPRDIVSGDFYFFARVNQKIIVSIFDCTGHGVPAAFLSVLGYSYLNQIINYQRITSPNIILDLLDENVRNVLTHNGTSQNRESLDAAVCLIDLEERTLDFSGSRRNLLAVQDGNIFDFKGNRFSVASEWKPKETEFTRQRIRKNEETNFDPEKCSFYIYSDGYPDQFGKDGKKLTSKKFSSLLQRLAEHPMSEQRALLSRYFSQWKGTEKQLDDVVVIGFRF